MKGNEATAGNGPLGKLRRVFGQWGRSYKRMLALAATQKKLLIGATVFLATGSALGLVVPQLVRVLVDGALAGGMGSLNRALMWLVLLALTHGTAVAMRFYLFTLAGQRIVCDLRAQTYDCIMAQEVGFFDQRKTGELLSRLSADTQVLQSTVTVNVSMVLRHCATAVGSVALLIYTSPLLTGLMLLLVPAVVIGAVLAARPLRLISRRVQDALARAGEVAEETISGVRTVRAFGREGRESARYRAAVGEAFSAMKARTRFVALFQGALMIAGILALGLVLWYGGRLVVDGTMSVGELTSFIMYTVLLAMSLAALGSLFTDFVSAAGAAERLFELLDRTSAVPLSGGRTLETVRGEIRFENVGFHYPTRPDTAALKGVDIAVHPGEVVALVGPSGSGKSTVAALLSRFYDPDEGVVSLDGVPLQELDATWLRRQIGVVSQEPILFSTSIEANIGYGADDVAPDAVRRAAGDANAAGFIDAFKDGYATEVGERGVRLSGGQKQRVAIARALLKNPRVLILDEATSALDAESEFLVKQALDRLMRGRTCLIIAHRLSTVKDADKVLVLDGGRVVESGTHDGLMQKSDSVYRRLVERQFLHVPKVGQWGDAEVTVTASPGETPLDEFVGKA